MKHILLLLILTYTFLTSVYANNTFNLSEEKLKNFSKKYGYKARERIILWDKMIENARYKDTINKLKDVNDYFNKIQYKLDKDHWRKNDYWASTFEFIGTGAGDCEDYANAKYFALKKLGISEKKLRITYVKLLTKNSKYEQSHMVLTYYHKTNSIPIVLDNINRKLQLASKRKDLKPVYSFNKKNLDKDLKPIYYLDKLSKWEYGA